MKTIWKFELLVEDEQTILMPLDAVVLAVQFQGTALCLWALVNPHTTERHDRTFRIYGTGHPITDKDFNGLDYLGTVQQMGGALVWHIFEKS